MKSQIKVQQRRRTAASTLPRLRSLHAAARRVRAKALAALAALAPPRLYAWVRRGQVPVTPLSRPGLVSGISRGASRGAWRSTRPSLARTPPLVSCPRARRE